MKKSKYVIIFSAVLLSSFLIFPSVSGYMPLTMTTINGTATSNYASDFLDVRSITPQFFISDTPISIFINSHYLELDIELNYDTIISITDPTGKISEFNVQIISGNIDFLYLVNVDAPLGLYTFLIPISSANGSFEILSEDSQNKESETKIPDWVKAIFLWYGQDKVSENELLNAIEFLINQGTINISNQKDTSYLIDKFTIKIITSGGEMGNFETTIITSKFLDENDSKQADILRRLISESKIDNIPIPDFIPKCCDQISTTITINAYSENQEIISKKFHYSLPSGGDPATRELIDIIYEIESAYPELTKDGPPLPYQDN